VSEANPSYKHSNTQTYGIRKRIREPPDNNCLNNDVNDACHDKACGKMTKGHTDWKSVMITSARCVIDGRSFYIAYHVRPTWPTTQAGSRRHPMSQTRALLVVYRDWVAHKTVLTARSELRLLEEFMS